MMMRNKPGFFGAILILSMLACVVPGLSQPVAAPLDPAMLPTIVVLTANAAMTQTAVAVPAGDVPPGDPLVSPTPAPNETALLVSTGGATKFTHVTGGYEITFPAGWVTVRPNSEEFDRAYKGEAAQNEMLLDQMNYDLTSYEPGVDQLFSYPVRPDIEEDFAFGFSKLKWIQDDPVPVTQSSMGQTVRDWESSGEIPGFRADTAQIYQNGNHVELIEIGGPFSLTDDQGGVVPFYSTIVYFKPDDNSTVRITFHYLKDFQLALAGDVASVINSIKLLEP
jgi:hypothetical protein